MADLTRIGNETLGLIDNLAADLTEEDEIGELMLICEIKTNEGSYIQWRCSSESYLVQRGLVAWANDGFTNDASRIADEEGEDA